MQHEGQAISAGKPSSHAQMAESVDALVSNTSGATRAGSTPALGTNRGEEQSSPRFSFAPTLERFQPYLAPTLERNCPKLAPTLERNHPKLAPTLEKGAIFAT